VHLIFLKLLASVYYFDMIAHYSFSKNM